MKIEEYIKQGDFFGFFWIFFSMYCIQHCLICRPSDTAVSEDAEIEPRTVTTSALAVRRSNHQARSHPRLGLGTEFRSEKIPRNGLGMISVIPRKKAVIPRHSEFRGRANSEARNGMKRNGIPRKNGFSSTEQFRRHSESLFLFFIAWKGIPSYVLFRGMVRNGIPRICIYFGSTEKSSLTCSVNQLNG